MKIIILGAGLTGLSTAYHLEKKGNYNYKLFEKESVAGGLCRTEKCGDFLFDYAEHLLHLKDKDTINLVNDLLKDNLQEHSRDVDIYFKKIYIPYPFQAHLGYLPRKEKLECFRGALTQGIANKKKKIVDFNDWIEKTFGKGIAKHFMTPYNTKLWTVHPKEMTLEWMSEYVPKINKWSLIKNAFSRTKRKMGYNQTFLYPKEGGIQVLPNAFCQNIKPVYLNHECIKIDLLKKEAYFKNGLKESYDCLINTMPLKTFVKIISNAPASISQAGEKLKINKVLNINIGVNGINDREGKHWIYFPQSYIPFHRQGYWSSFSKKLAPPETFSLFAEIAYKENSSINKNKLYNDTIVQLGILGILKNKEEIIKNSFLDIENAYVIFDKFHKECTGLIKDFLTKNKIFTIGRYGAWEYSAMGEAIEWGRNTAKII